MCSSAWKHQINRWSINVRMPSGDHHHVNGNYKTLKKVLLKKKLLDQMNENPKKFCLEWISSIQARKFVDVAKEMKEKIEKMKEILN